MTVFEWWDNLVSKWLDVNGFIKTRKSNRDSGNGMLYESINCLFLHSFGMDFCRDRLRIVYEKLQYKKGCLKRTPDNKFGPESFDDYLGFLTFEITIGRTQYAREIFWFGVRHLFFYCNDGFSFKSWMVIKPQIIALAFAASYPSLRIVSRPILWICLELISFKENPDEESSGNQLSWVLAWAYARLYESPSDYPATVFIHKICLANPILTAKRYFYSSMQNYYDTDHPFLNLPSNIKHIWPWALNVK